MISVVLCASTLPFYRSRHQGSLSLEILQWVTKSVGGSLEAWTTTMDALGGDHLSGRKKARDLQGSGTTGDFQIPSAAHLGMCLLLFGFL